MKIAVILLVCLVGATYEQKINFPNLQTREEPSNEEPSVVQDPRAVIFSFIGLFSTTYITTTSVSWTTVSATVTTAVVASCIPQSYFSATTACRRRRAIFEDAGLAEHLLPSSSDELVASVVAEDVKRQVKPEILSSYQETDDRVSSHAIRKRYIYSRTTSTVTSSSTIYYFTSTTYTKTLSIVATTSALMCLPSGVSVC